MADKASKIDPKLVDELLKDWDPETVLSSEGLLGDLKKALAERIVSIFNLEKGGRLPTCTSERMIFSRAKHGVGVALDLRKPEGIRKSILIIGQSCQLVPSQFQGSCIR